jgi:hypothetical protein
MAVRAHGTKCSDLMEHVVEICATSRHILWYDGNRWQLRPDGQHYSEKDNQPWRTRHECTVTGCGPRRKADLRQQPAALCQWQQIRVALWHDSLNPLRR